ncbi:MULTISPECIES: hypothetical protein [unclassified Microcoleus]|uniref:hypothetical protein n=1 Tax=unclassified Microcoleus TaxID=2642155 RepID=UPI002FD5042D
MVKPAATSYPSLAMFFVPHPLVAPTVIAQIKPTVQSLRDGDYRYRASFAIDRPFREIQFRK